MTQLFIILAQSVTGAVITIVALLLVAALIGYLTAWFYAKSVYTPVIKGLEQDKANLQNEVAGLKNDVTRLTGEVNELKDNIKKLEAKYAANLAEKDKELNDLRSRLKE